MSISKTTLTITSIAFATLFGGGAYVVMNLGSLAHTTAERIASDALGVDVNIGKLDISLQNKNATVTNLRISNPPGFQKPHALSVEKISVTLDTVTRELVGFKDITVQGTNVNVEVTQNGTNLQAIRKGMPKTHTNAANDNQQDEQEKAPPLKVIVQRLAVTEASVNPSVTLLQDQDLKGVTVPNIVLTGIGEKENGILAREAVAQIWTQLSARFSKAAASAGFYEGLSADKLKELGVSTIKNRISNEVEKVGDKLKGLFGN